MMTIHAEYLLLHGAWWKSEGDAQEVLRLEALLPYS
jgi:hypothetical protein